MHWNTTRTPGQGTRCALRALLGVALLRAAALAQPYAYVANLGSDTVSVVDTASLQVLTSVTVGDDPDGVAVTPDGTRVYVTNFLSDNLSVIDAKTNILTATFEVGSGPVGVAVSPDGAFAYVTNRGSDTVSVIRVATNALVDTLAVGSGPNAVAITPDGRFAYVTNSFTKSPGTVSVIDLRTNSVTATVPVYRNPNRLAITPDGRFVYVGNFRSWNVAVIDTVSNTVATTVPLLGRPSGIAVNPNGAYVYVATLGGTVEVIDTTTNTVSSVISVGSEPYGIATTRNGGAGYVANFASGTVSVINLGEALGSEIVTVGDKPFAVAVNCVGGGCSEPPYTPRPTRTPTPTLAVTVTPTRAPVPVSEFLCSAGLRDGLACSSDGDCPSGACVIAAGVCDGGNDDGLPCDCPGGTCGGAMCVEGARSGQQCDVTFNCAGDGPCIGTQKICLGGINKAFSCLRDAQCPGDICRSTGQYCRRGEFDGFACVDDNDCVNGFCSSPGTPTVAVEVGTATGTAAQQVQFTVTLDTNENDVAGVQNDITYDRLTTVAVRANGKPDCTVNPAINKTATSFAFQPFGCTPTGDCARLRAIVLATDNSDPIPDGAVLYTCNVDIAPTAAPAAYPLGNSQVIASSPVGLRIAASGINGQIVVTGASGLRLQSQNTSASGGSGCQTGAPAGEAVAWPLLGTALLLSAQRSWRRGGRH